MLGNTVNSGSSPYTLSYGYDELGHLVSRAIDGGTNTESTTYDALGRVTQVSNALGAFNYTPYNATNMISSISYPNGQAVEYSYYTSGASNERLQSITDLGPSTDGTISQFTYGYSAAGDIISWTQQADANTPVVYGFSYDGARQLKSAIETSATGGAPLDTYAYWYDPAGNRLGQQIGNTVTTSFYNDLNQVTGVTGTGNLQMLISGSLSEPGTVTAAGALATTDSNNDFIMTLPVVAGSNSIPMTATSTGTSNNQTNKTLSLNVAGGGSIPLLQYDANGNLTSDGTRTYTWDGANRLIEVAYPGGANSQFSYDGLGRRVQIVETGTNGSVTSTKNLIWDGMVIREERNPSNAVTKMYFNNGVQIGGSNYFYTRDHLGSVRELTDASQNVVTRYSYDPYGQQTGGTVNADFGFTGLYVHQPSGMNLAPYRAYSASMGRWISRDPVGSLIRSTNPLTNAEMLEGPNLYAYVRNSPLDRTDTSGLGLIDILNWIKNLFTLHHEGPKCPGDRKPDRRFEAKPVTANHDPRRWLSRDPVASPTLLIVTGKGRLIPFSRWPNTPTEALLGPNLYKYVSNSPIDDADPLGLFKDPDCVASCQQAKDRSDALLRMSYWLGTLGCIEFPFPINVICLAHWNALEYGASKKIEADYNDCVNSCPNVCPLRGLAPIVD